MTIKIVNLEENRLKQVFARMYAFLTLNIIAFISCSYMINQNIHRFYKLYSAVYHNTFILFMLLPLGMYALLRVLFNALLNETSSTFEIVGLLFALILVESFLFVPFLQTFTAESIALGAGLASSILFVMSLIGAYTSIDLSQYSHICFLGMLMISIFELAAYYFSVSYSVKLTSMLMIGLFMFITAYDVQAIKKYKELPIANNRLALLGSIILFLDFIVLLQRILIVLGERRNK